MKEALKEMHRQVGDFVINKEGVTVKGLLVRHLVLSNNLAGSKEIFEFVTKEISENTFINLMNQYSPYFHTYRFPELSRRITLDEYSQAIDKKDGLKRPYKE